MKSSLWLLPCHSPWSFSPSWSRVLRVPMMRMKMIYSPRNIHTYTSDCWKAWWSGCCTGASMTLWVCLSCIILYVHFKTCQAPLKFWNYFFFWENPSVVRFKSNNCLVIISHGDKSNFMHFLKMACFCFHGGNIPCPSASENINSIMNKF